jgi:ADP-heptose:LPS heptosyltransferase
MIVISPFAKELRNGKHNPKSPTVEYWKELIELIDEPIIQIGIEGEIQLVADFRRNLTLEGLKDLIKECRTWISCDSMFQHLAWDQGKPGIVLWSVSDPLIFGHPENINLLKDRSCLADEQFMWWEFVDHNPDKFVKPEEVIQYVKNMA